MIKLLGKILLSLMFGLSVIKNLTGGFKGSVELVKKLKFIPLPELSVIIGMIIKGFGAYSIITGHYKKIALPLLIAFLILVMIIFNNPLKFPEKKWMFMALTGVLGGLLIIYSEN